ncbi:MAG: rhomboid family intramembrane serine protease [Deltaproteobacteria bacterium]|nr:rhomboid family intramembrane serine protease [Deltaproteobacteria bacterium]
MFPIRDENPKFHTTMITYAIIVVNALVWIFFQGAGTQPGLIKSIFSFGLIPGELLGTIPAGTRVNIGGGMAYVIERSGNSLSLISHMFMHGGWFHIIGNMWFLTILGDNVEDSMGSVRFLFFYLLCGLAAAATQMALNPAGAVPMVGASGAIGGVMGAYVVLYPRAPVHMLVFLGFFITRIIVPAYFMLGYWFLLQLAGIAFSAGSRGGGVAFGAHVGGFVAGVALVFLFRSKERVREKRAHGGVWSSWKR